MYMAMKRLYILYFEDSPGYSVRHRHGEGGTVTLVMAISAEMVWHGEEIPT